MQTLIIASNNAHKIAEIKAILDGLFAPIVSLREAGIDIDVVEDGDTFEANALIKARAIAALCPDSAVLADDSGLEVDALGGQPGVYSARYAGEGHDDAANNKKLLQALADVPDDERSARFVSAIALLRPGQDELVVRGSCDGVIGHAPRGTNGFGYDPLFVFPDRSQTFAELTEDEKNAISHRGRSLAMLRERVR